MACLNKEMILAVSAPFFRWLIASCRAFRASFSLPFWAAILTVSMEYRLLSLRAREVPEWVLQAIRNVRTMARQDNGFMLKGVTAKIGKICHADKHKACRVCPLDAA